MLCDLILSLTLDETIKFGYIFESGIKGEFLQSELVFTSGKTLDLINFHTESMNQPKTFVRLEWFLSFPPLSRANMNVGKFALQSRFLTVFNPSPFLRLCHLLGSNFYAEISFKIRSCPLWGPYICSLFPLCHPKQGSWSLCIDTALGQLLASALTHLCFCSLPLASRQYCI